MVAARGLREVLEERRRAGRVGDVGRHVVTDQLVGGDRDARVAVRCAVVLAVPGRCRLDLGLGASLPREVTEPVRYSTPAGLRAVPSPNVEKSDASRLHMNTCASPVRKTTLSAGALDLAEQPRAVGRVAVPRVAVGFRAVVDRRDHDLVAR